MSRAEPLPALTGLRFFAALHVVVFHFGFGWLVDAPAWMQAISQCGFASVGLFFVLSGFVLSYNYLGPDGRMAVEPRTFWIARIARIYPVYVLALVLLAPHVMAGSLAANTPAMAAAKLAVGGGSALLLVHTWLPPATLYWNPPGWSVAVEAFFYAVFPALAVRLGRWTRARLLWALAGLWALGLLPSLLYLALEPDGAGPASMLSRGVWLTVLKFNPVLRLPEFLMGVVLGRLFLQEGRGRGRTGGLMAPVAALLTLGAFASSARLPFPLLHNALLAPVYALLVYGLARGGGALGWLLSRRPLVQLGEASYALYILHHPVWLAVGVAAAAVAPWVELSSPRALFTVFLPVVLAASWLSYRYVEMPLRGWVRRVLQAWTERGRRAAAVEPGV